jgi:exonuclease III
MCNNIEQLEINLINESRNYSRLDFGRLAKENKGIHTLTLLNLNIRSQPCNGTGLATLLAELLEDNFSFDIITLQETWLNSDLEPYANIPGYNFTCKNKPTVREGGGVGIYIKEGINYKVRSDISFSNHPEHYYDCLFIEIQGDQNNKDIVIGTVYRPPYKDTVELFTSDMDRILKAIDLENKNCIISGDTNINLLNIDTHHNTATYLDIMMANGYIPTITKPTRIGRTSATLLDHIFIKFNCTNEYIAGSIEADITDHLPNFIFLHQAPVQKTGKPKYVMYRKFNEVNISNLSRSLQVQDWSDVHNACRNDNTDLACNMFMNIYTRNLDEKIPIVKNKFNKYKHKLQPWLTKGILISTHTRDKLNKLRNAHRNAVNYDQINNQYKTYRNLLKRVIRMAQSTYWENKFSEAKSDMKRTWINIKNIMNKNRKSTTHSSFLFEGMKITNPKKIANAFNSHFSTIGQNLANRISHRTCYKEFLKHPVQSSFFMNDTSCEEILKLLTTLVQKLVQVLTK